MGDYSQPAAFYGQDSNEITITRLNETDTDIKEISVEYVATRGSEEVTGSMPFAVTASAKAKLKIQQEATKARATWFKDAHLDQINPTVDQSSDELKKHIAAMKLDKQTAKEYSNKLKDFKTFQTSRIKSEEEFVSSINSRKTSITKLLLEAPIKDEKFEKSTHKSLRFTAVHQLEQLLYKDAKQFAVKCKKYPHLLSPFSNLSSDLDAAMLTLNNGQLVIKIYEYMDKYIADYKNNVDTVKIDAFRSRLNELNVEMKHYELTDTLYYYNILKKAVGNLVNP